MSQKSSEQQADDLTRIQGIGDGVKARLNQAGILTYEQLTAQSPETLAALLKEMIGVTAARIEKQDWIGQARAHAEAAQEGQDPLEEPTADQQHYETFTLELLLDEGQNVRRTRAFHVQEGKQESWAGWDEKHLVAFLSERAGFEAPDVEAVPVEVLVVSEPRPQSVPAVMKAPYLGLANFDIISIDTRAPAQMLSTDQPFGVLLTLDTTNLPDEERAHLSCKAQIYAQQLGSRDPNLVASIEDWQAPEGAGQIELVGEGLPEGVYRISAHLKVRIPSEEAGREIALPLSHPGSLVQVL